jgi:hypothetical protein
VSPTYILDHPAGGASPAVSSGPIGYTPAQISNAYGFNQIPLNGADQTIAIVDAYDHPSIAGDLHAFDQQFGLADPTLVKVNQSGGTSYPAPDPNWAVEISLDVEWAHAIAPGARILLVEANSNSSSDLYAAVNYARNQSGVSVISMSWGGPEFSGETSNDPILTTPSGHQGVTFVASSGDSGTILYPAASRNVLAVGGTTLTIGSGNTYGGETAWSGSGGGISTYEPRPGYQVRVSSSGYRTNPDVAYDADPVTGFAVYDSYTYGSATPWQQVGGTSAGAPQWAALIVLADQGRAQRGLGSLDGPSQTLPLLYHLSTSAFHDITSGRNANYSAGPGYDLVTGLGSPVANQVVAGLVQPFTAANDGSLYQLDQGGYLWRYSGANGWVQIGGYIQSFAVSPDGSVYDLNRDALLFRGVPMSDGQVDWTPIGGYIQSFAVSPDGSVYDLSQGGVLRRGIPGSNGLVSWARIDSSIQSFAVSPDGSVYDLSQGGVLRRGIPGSNGLVSWARIDSSIQSFAVSPDGSVYDLSQGGVLRRGIPGSNGLVSWARIDSSIQSFAVAPDDSVYALAQAGRLWHGIDVGGPDQTWTPVPQFARTSSGVLWALGSDGVLRDFVGTSLKGSLPNVRSFAVATDQSVTALKTDGSLWKYTSSGWIRIG